jgi:hypothetical protein
MIEAYLFRLPKTVPAGCVVVHNNVRPTRRLGSRGFRAWLSLPDPATLEVCPCAWAQELGQHFRVSRLYTTQSANESTHRTP